MFTNLFANVEILALHTQNDVRFLRRSEEVVRDFIAKTKYAHYIALHDCH